MLLQAPASVPLTHASRVNPVVKSNALLAGISTKPGLLPLMSHAPNHDEALAVGRHIEFVFVIAFEKHAWFSDARFGSEADVDCHHLVAVPVEQLAAVWLKSRRRSSFDGDRPLPAERGECAQVDL